MSLGLKICGSFPDNSGYGESNRADVAALFSVGVDLTLLSVPQTIETRSTGWAGELCKHLEDREIDYKIELLHLTPDLYPRYTESGKYHIGRLPWEVDKLPREWIEPLNKIQEVWTMTEAQAEIIRKSGVTTPIHVFSEPLDISNANRAIEPFIIPNFNGTVFYSIFHWIERKDPYSLLTTYWKTFEGREDVILVLKTFRVGYSKSDFELIKKDIERWKSTLKLRHYPRIALIEDLWNSDGIWRLHKMGGIFVSTSHGEGFCRPVAEASLLGNPVIMTGKTGLADIYPPDHFFPIKCFSAPVIPQSHISWYQKGQNWLNIDLDDFSKQLLEVYNNPLEAKERAEKARAFTKEHLSYSKIGSLMRDRLLEIERFL